MIRVGGVVILLWLRMPLPLPLLLSMMLMLNLELDLDLMTHSLMQPYGKPGAVVREVVTKMEREELAKMGLPKMRRWTGMYVQVTKEVLLRPMGRWIVRVWV